MPLFAPFKITAHPDKKFRQIKLILTALETRMLVIDEFHHMLSGPYHKQRHYLNAIKHLGNELRISIIAVGTEQVFAALSSDPQMANRFEPIVLPKWKLNEEFQRLLVTLEHRLIVPLINIRTLFSCILGFWQLEERADAIGLLL